MQKNKLGCGNCPTTEVIDEGTRCIHEPQPNITAIGVKRPTCDAARGNECPIFIKLHISICPRSNAQLIATDKGDWDIRSVLHPILAGMVGPDLDALSGGIIHDVDQTAGGVGATLRLQDQAVFIARGAVELGEGHIRFLISAKGRGVPKDGSVPAAGGHI